MSVKFGDCEYRPSTGRLTKGGRIVKLTGQPLHLLVFLLEQHDRVVTREEIRARLWPDTHVGFDHSLDVALNRLRAALGDRGREPAYIETVPRIGYRFIAPVTVATPAAGRSRARVVAARVAAYAFVALAAAAIALAVVHQHYGEIIARATRTAR
jgi:DNA-binding winged helix-turn-helix (wHTH) protein